MVKSSLRWVWGWCWGQDTTVTRWSGPCPYKRSTQEKKQTKHVLWEMERATYSFSQVVREGFSEVSSELMPGSRSRMCQAPKGEKTWGVHATERSWGG